MKSVSEQEFRDFLSSYPRPLTRDALTICEPPQLQYNDFTLGDWPESVVATKNEKSGSGFEYSIAETVAATHASDKGENDEA